MINLGIPALDKAFKGGLDNGKIILIKSKPRAGKIVFGYKFLEQGLKQEENCFYFFHKANTQEAIEETENYGLSTKKLKFINSNMIYGRTTSPNVVICDLNSPSAIDVLDGLFLDKGSVRGVITVISVLFSKGLFSIAYYLLNHLRRLVDQNPHWTFLLTIEQGAISEEEMQEAEKLVDVGIELVEKKPGEGDLLIYKSYKPVTKKSFNYKVKTNEFIVT
ncbi:hypothetical protein J4208_04600 [Candidatus Woesearchaeota archaeon]|nr:hypothetical protein [Candidatus Woesearchaeota archaeon]